MERRLASFLFCDQDGYRFMDSESFDQHTFSLDAANLAEMELQDGCEVYLILDRAGNIVQVELAEPMVAQEHLYRVYESVTREKFAPEYTRLVHQKLSQYGHRATFIYLRDPVALVLEFTSADAPYAIRSVTRVPLAKLLPLDIEGAEWNVKHMFFESWTV